MAKEKEERILGLFAKRFLIHNLLASGNEISASVDSGSDGNGRTD